MNDDKLENGYWYSKGQKIEDIKIRQYMRLDHLIQLLETGMYHANRRKTYTTIDNNEGYDRLKIEFTFTPVGSSIPPQPKSNEEFITFKETVECPTSCWTKKEHESYLMWKNYATEMGACIESTVGRLVSSLKIDFSHMSENKLICGNMNYTKNFSSTTEEARLFNKSLYYSDEEEFRFYFHIKSAERIESTKNYVRLPIDTKVLIDEILLSPFIGKEAVNKFARVIKCSYGIDNVRQSNIKIR